LLLRFLDDGLVQISNLSFYFYHINVTGVDDGIKMRLCNATNNLFHMFIGDGAGTVIETKDFDGNYQTVATGWTSDAWHRMDIHINWSTYEHEIFLDDVSCGWFEMLNNASDTDRGAKELKIELVNGLRGDVYIDNINISSPRKFYQVEEEELPDRIWQSLSVWNTTLVNTSSWNGIGLWNTTLSNASWEWQQVSIWNTSLVNNTFSWNGMLVWNTTLWNSSTVFITVSNVYPGDDSSGIPLQPTMYLTVNHSEGQAMNISWYYGPLGGENNLLGTDSGFYNSTQSEVNWNASERMTDYHWRVMINAGDSYENFTYGFRTEGYGGGHIISSPYVGVALGAMALIIAIVVFLFIRRRRT